MAETLESLLIDPRPGDEEPETEEVEDDEAEEEEPDEELGEAGKKALRAERQRVRELVAENKRLKAAQARKRAPKVDEDEIRSTVRAEVAREFGVKLAREKAVSQLTEAGYLGSASRGAKQLDLDDLVDDNGDVDTEALRDVVAEWRDDEPNLFAASESPARRRAGGSADLGKKRAKREEADPLASALGKLVGRRELA